MTTDTGDHIADAYVRGYCDGHTDGQAIGQAHQHTVQQLQAAAWELGHQAGYATGHRDAREDIARTISDLATQYADIDEAFTRVAHTTAAQRTAREVADMARHVAAGHTQNGTRAWVGLRNGGALPSADWVPSPEHLAALRAKAAAALAAAPDPVLTSWAQVRANVDDRTWARILGDLAPGPRGSRDQAIEAAKTSKNGAA